MAESAGLTRWASSQVRVRLRRARLYGRPTFTYLWGGLGLIAAVLLTYLLRQSLEGSPEPPLAEAQVAALFTIATFLPVVIALFLQGKPGVRINGGWAVWRSSLGVAAVAYAVALLLASIVSILVLADRDLVSTLWLKISLGATFCVIIWLPVLIVTAAHCSGAKFTSRSADALIRLESRGSLPAVSDLTGVIKDLRDAALSEYDQGNRRAVRERLDALKDIACECDDMHLATQSLEEIGYVACVMVRDRDLALLAVAHLVEAGPRQQVDSNETVDLQDKKVSELMSIWATAIESGASPMIANKCAEFLREQQCLRNTRLNPDLSRKLDSILMAYSNTVHEEAGLILTFSVFGHVRNFPEGSLDQLSQESGKATDAVAELLLEADTPTKAHYKKYVAIFAKSALFNATGQYPIAKKARRSLRLLASKSADHREAIALACQESLRETSTRADGISLNGALLAEVLLLTRPSNGSGARDLPSVSDEAKVELLEQLKARIQISPRDQCRLAAVSVTPLFQEKSLEWGQDPHSRIYVDVVLTFLISAWSAHMPSQSDFASASASGERRLVDIFRSYAESIPLGHADQLKLTKKMTYQLKQHNWPLEPQLSSLDVRLIGSEPESQTHILVQAYWIRDAVVGSGKSLRNLFAELALDSRASERLVVGIATTLCATDELQVQATGLEGEAFLDKDELVTVSDAQAALVDIAVGALLAQPDGGRQRLWEMSKDTDLAAAGLKLSQRILEHLDGDQFEGSSRSSSLSIGVRIAQVKFVLGAYGLDGPGVRPPISDKLEEDLCRVVTDLLDPIVPAAQIPKPVIQTVLYALFGIMGRVGSHPKQRLSGVAGVLVENIPGNSSLYEAIRVLLKDEKFVSRSPYLAEIRKSLDAA